VVPLIDSKKIQLHGGFLPNFSRNEFPAAEQSGFPSDFSRYSMAEISGGGS
jgi:hypothetical protein